MHAGWSMQDVWQMLPPLGIVVLALAIAVVFHSMMNDGAKEGQIAYESGRYLKLYPNSDKVTGNLLAPAPKQAEIIPMDNNPAMSAANQKIEVDDKDVKLRLAPNMAIVEKEDGMLLPIISPDGVKPWQYYGRPFTREGNMSRISVIVTGLGINKELTITASKLPAPVCLSVSPYAEQVPVWMQSMRVLGHEFLLDLPLEPSNYPANDPGPEALLTRIMPEENMAHLKKIMGATTGYVGLVAPADEVFFSGEKDFIEPVVKDFADRGVMLVFSKSQDRPELTDFMKKADTVHLDADIYVRYGSDASDIKQKLSAIEAVSLKRGNALIIIDASPVALQVLQEWAESVHERGFQLMPVSTLARYHFS